MSRRPVAKMRAVALHRTIAGSFSVCSLFDSLAQHHEVSGHRGVVVDAAVLEHSAPAGREGDDSGLVLVQVYTRQVGCGTDHWRCLISAYVNDRIKRVRRIQHGEGVVLVLILYVAVDDDDLVSLVYSDSVREKVSCETPHSS